MTMSDFEQTRLMGATMQIPTGGADAMRTQMGGVAACPVCQVNTPLTEAYCGECGFLLASTPMADTGEIAPLSESEMAAAELVDVANGRRHRLRSGQNTVGRVGTDLLSEDGTVSRHHARLLVEGDTVTVEDLGSSNGTKVGDLRIGPNQPVTATHGTPVRFGNWRLMLEIAGFGTPTAPHPNATVMTTTPDVGALLNGDRTMLNDDRTLLAAPLPDLAKTTMETPSDLTATFGTARVSPAESSEQELQEPSREESEILAQMERDSGPADTIYIRLGNISIGRRPGNTIVISQDTFVSGRHAEIVTDNAGTHLTDLGSTNGTVVNGQKLAPNEPQLLLEGDEIQLGQSRFTFRFFATEPQDEEARMDYEGDPQAAVILEALGLQNAPNAG